MIETTESNMYTVTQTSINKQKHHQRFNTINQHRSVEKNHNSNRMNIQNTSPSGFNTMTKFDSSDNYLFNVAPQSTRFSCIESEQFNQQQLKTLSRNSQINWSKFNPRKADSDSTPLLTCYFFNEGRKANMTQVDKEKKKEILKQYRIKTDIKSIPKDIELSQVRKLSTKHFQYSSKPYFNIRDEYFKDPIKSLKKISINKQIMRNINDINLNKQLKAYSEAILIEAHTKEVEMKMPKIKINSTSLEKHLISSSISDIPVQIKKDLPSKYF